MDDAGDVVGGGGDGSEGVLILGADVLPGVGGVVEVVLGGQDAGCEFGDGLLMRILAGLDVNQARMDGMGEFVEVGGRVVGVQPYLSLDSTPGRFQLADDAF